MGPSSCVQRVSSLGNPGDGGSCFTVSRQSSSVQPPTCHQRSGTHTAAGVASVMCCSALTLSLLFAREKGPAEAPAHTWAAHAGQWAQRVTSPPGLGHFGDTARCGWRSSQHAHAAAGQGPGSWQPAWGGKNRQKHQNRHNPRGPGWGGGAYGGCHGRRAAGKSIAAQPDPADPIGSAPGVCHMWLLKF